MKTERAANHIAAAAAATVCRRVRVYCEINKYDAFTHCATYKRNRSGCVFYSQQTQGSHTHTHTVSLVCVSIRGEAHAHRRRVFSMEEHDGNKMKEKNKMYGENAMVSRCRVHICVYAAARVVFHFGHCKTHIHTVNKHICSSVAHLCVLCNVYAVRRYVCVVEIL